MRGCGHLKAGDEATRFLAAKSGAGLKGEVGSLGFKGLERSVYSRLLGFGHVCDAVCDRGKNFLRGWDGMGWDIQGCWDHSCGDFFVFAELLRSRLCFTKPYHLCECSIFFVPSLGRRVAS